MRRLSFFLLVLSSLLVACGGLTDATATAPAQGRVRVVPTSVPQPTADVNALYAIPPDDPRALGDPNARITILDYSDFE